MKILFVTPKISPIFFERIWDLTFPWQHWQHLRRDFKKHERNARRVFYGLGTITIAALLSSKEYNIDLVDENFSEIDFNKNYGLVAISGQLLQSPRVKELTQIFTEKGVHVVVGGVQATLFANEFVGKGVSVICGEGEEQFLQFLRDFANGRPQAIYEETAQETTFYHSPIPRYDLVSQNRYNLVGVQTTRGCPYHCEYCHVTDILGPRYRHKPVKQVIEEIKIVKRFWPDSMFFFFDDNLFSDVKYATELFEEIGKTIDLGPYGSHADLSIYDKKDLLKLLTDAGKPTLAFGFETLSPENAEYIKNPVKTRLIPKYREIVDILQRRGIGVTGTFMFGFKGDTRESAKNTLDFVRESGIKAYFTVYTATPHSKLYRRLEREYREQIGPFEAKGYAKFKLLNDYLARKNDIEPAVLEKKITGALKDIYPDALEIARLEGLAVGRFYRDGMFNF